MSNMTPSVTTAAQAGKISDLLVAALRKSKLPADGVQNIIETQGGPLTDELIGVIRRRVDMASDVILRVANVDGSLSPKEALVATGRSKYLNDRIVGTIPDSVGGETPVTFFKPGKTLSNEQLAEEYAKRGLKPAHPSAVAKVNEDDPSFADDHPNATVWDVSSYALFDRWDGERDVFVGRYDGEWGGGWWFAGVPAS